MSEQTFLQAAISDAERVFEKHRTTVTGIHDVLSGPHSVSDIETIVARTEDLINEVAVDGERIVQRLRDLVSVSPQPSLEASMWPGSTDLGDTMTIQSQPYHQGTQPVTVDVRPADSASVAQVAQAADDEADPKVTTPSPEDAE